MNEFDWARSRIMIHLPPVPDWAAAEGMESSTPSLRLWIIGRCSTTRYGHKATAK